METSFKISSALDLLRVMILLLSAQVAAGTRFGPFLGKWVLEPQREEHAWEVSPGPGSGFELPACPCKRSSDYFGVSPVRQNVTQNIYHTLHIGATVPRPVRSHSTAVRRHLATFCGKFGPEAIFSMFSTILGILSRALLLGAPYNWH